MGGAVGTVMNLGKSITTIVSNENNADKDKNDDKDEDRDPRRRNSLAFYISQFVNYEGEDYAKVIEAVKKDKYSKTGGKPPNIRNSSNMSNSLPKLLFLSLQYMIIEFSKIADAVIQGNMKELRNQVFVYFKFINRPYKDHHIGNTLLHMICQEGYYNMLTYLSNPANRSGLDSEVLNFMAKNDRNRIPLLLCFTPPTATVNIHSAFT